MARSWEAVAPASKTKTPMDEYGKDDPMFMYTHLNDPDTVSEAGTGNKSIGPPPAVPAPVAPDEDDVALPTPISYTEFKPCKITSADGRSETIYTPIPGFEHLFKAKVASQGPPCFGFSSTPRQPTDRVQPDTPVSPPSRGSIPRQQRPEPRDRRTHKLTDAPRKRAAPSPSKRRTQKRPHTGTAAPRARARTSWDSSDDGDNEVEICDDKAAAINLPSRPTEFHTGNFDALKVFLRMRLEELTMKPLRPIVTEWVKDLVPKRQTDYGPYHKRHAESPADPAPHWWPNGIQYVEPSHLPKTGVLDLAVDLILQHRNTSIDAKKRETSWTSRLRLVAEYQVNKTPKEMFSSSKDPGFSESMKARALDSVLPSMFDVVQAYEDYVVQNNVWERINDPDANLPKGKLHSYLPVPRPKQPLPKKRVRITQVVPTKVPKVETHEESGSETEVDEAMERYSRRYLRRQERSQAQVPEAQVPEAPAPEVHKIDVPSPAETPTHYTTPASFELEEHPTTATSDSSFDQSLNELHLSSAKGGGFARADYGYANEMYQPMQDASGFSNACQVQLNQYPAQLLSTSPYSLFDTYSGTPSFGSSAAPGFTYERNDVFSPVPTGTSHMPDGTTTSFDGLPYGFNGLPYDSDVNHQGPSLYYSSTQYAGQPCDD